MKEELLKKYENIMQTKDICVGDGWVPLVEQALRLAEDYTSRGNSVRVLQVKEKFAALCIHISGKFTDNEVASKFYKEMGAIYVAASKTCEKCGSTENVKIDDSAYWVKTLCPSCTEKRKKERKTRQNVLP
jgi:hypothetical protein